MLTKEELLKLCDDAIEEKCSKKNEYYDNVMYLLNKRGFIDCAGGFEGTRNELSFECGFNCINVYSIVKYGHKSQIRLDIEIRECIDKLYETGGCGLLDRFVHYVATVSIPNFKAGNKIPNFVCKYNK